MGACLSKKESELEHRHVGVSGMHYHNHKNHEPYVNHSKAHKRPDTNTILGKHFEDIRKIYKFGKELGRGKCGVTYQCTEKSTGLKYACKSISKKKFVSKAEKEEIKREIQIMQHMSGKPNIVVFKGAYEDKNSVHIVMELCVGGQLLDRITAKRRYSERDAASVCKQIVNIVHICHFMGVMHRDLKPGNLLLSSNDDKATIVATDFGFSVFIEEGKVYTDVVGSVYYMAPEVLRQKYGKEIDIWSAGVILYILICGVPPFCAETVDGVFEAILQGHIDFYRPPWPIISNSAKDLVRKMLTQDPTKRITASQVLGSIHGLKKVEMLLTIDKPITTDELRARLQRLGSKLTEAEVWQLTDAIRKVNRSERFDEGWITHILTLRIRFKTALIIYA